MTDTNEVTVLKDYVNRYEAIFRQQDAAATDLAELTEEIKDAEFSPKDVAAMKKIAKLSINGKVQKAKDELAALDRVASAVGMDLFDFA